jgi:DNA-binding response OmpR family regulator
MPPDTYDVLSAATQRPAIAHRVLLVEDQPEAAAALKKSLESAGFEVVVAKDGGQAHSSFTMHRPDFVLLDVILPGASGFEICDWMKQSDSTVPVTILSVIDLPDARRLAERVGADGYLIKPCDTEFLVQHIRETAEAVWQRSHGMRPKISERVRFTCRCGKRFKVSASHRGKSLTCPECGEPLIVPRHEA